MNTAYEQYRAAVEAAPISKNIFDAGFIAALSVSHTWPERNNDRWADCLRIASKDAAWLADERRKTAEAIR